MLGLILFVLVIVLSTLTFVKEGFWAGCGATLILLLVFGKLCSMIYGA